MWLPIGLCLKKRGKKGKKGKKEKENPPQVWFLVAKKKNFFVQKIHMVTTIWFGSQRKKIILSPNKPLDDHTITYKKSYITQKNEKKKKPLVTTKLFWVKKKNFQLQIDK